MLVLDHTNPFGVKKDLFASAKVRLWCVVCEVAADGSMFGHKCIDFVFFRKCITKDFWCYFVCGLIKGCECLFTNAYR